MKILHFSDLHVSNHKFIPIDEFLNILKRIYKSAIKNKCKAIIFSGDFFDKKINPRWLYDKVIETFLCLDKIKWYLGVGNHDQNTMGHSLEIFDILNKQISHIEILELPATLKIGQHSIRILHGIASRAVLDNGFTVLESMRDIGEGELKGKVAYVALGHLHRHQRVSGHPFAFYAGSPLQLSFGEADTKKGWLIVDLDNKKIKYIKNNFSITHQNINVKMVEGKPVLDKEIPKNCCIKFIVTGTPTDSINFKIKYAKDIADGRKYIIALDLVQLTHKRKIEEITQKSSLEDDVEEYIKSGVIDIPKNVNKDRIIRELKQYIKRARDL